MQDQHLLDLNCILPQMLQGPVQAGGCPGRQALRVLPGAVSEPAE